MKKIEETRCPWCGSKIKFQDGITGKKGVYITKCCSKYIEEKISVLALWIAIIQMIAIIICIIVSEFEAGPHVFSIAGIPIFIFWTIYDKYLPFLRYTEKDACEKAEEAILGHANIHWYPMSKGGIGLPRLRIINNMIFPVCFIDKQGVPVSQTICVRLQKRYMVFWKNAQVRLITEDLWKEDKDGKVPWDKAEKFLIYNEGDVIGEGKIRKE